MNHEERVVRIHLIPLMLGFVLLGALSHSALRHFDQVTAPSQATARADLPAPSSAMGNDLEAVLAALSPAAVLAPVPLFIRGEGFDRCADAVGADGGQYICTWAI